jgi:nicotinamidase-related amidase
MTDPAPAIDPRRTALLMMDFQSGIVARVPDSEGLLERARALVALARRRAVTVGYVRVAFEADDYDAVPDTNKSFRVLAANRGMDSGAPETAVHDAIAPEPGDIVVRKTRVGAFSTTDLDRQLRDRGIDTIVLAGISTSGVVLSTVRDGADRDYRIYVVEDATADLDPAVHEILMHEVFPRQADVVSTAELSALLA